MLTRSSYSPFQQGEMTRQFLSVKNPDDEHYHAAIIPPRLECGPQCR